MSKEAKAVFVTLIDMLNSSEDKQSIKIDANGKGGGIMPLCIEHIGECSFLGTDHLPIYSFAHYYEQNGDLMRDPDVEFIVCDLRHIAIAGGLTDTNDLLECVGIWPSRFRQDGILLRDDELIVINEDGKADRYRERMYNDVCIFCSQWFKNIKWQQNIKVKVNEPALMKVN